MDPSAFTEKVEKLMAAGTNVKSKSSGKPARSTPKKKSTAAILTQEVENSLRESLSPAPAKGPHVSTRTSTGSEIHA